MIDAVSIFTKGGVVLWSFYFIKLNGNPIDQLIKKFFLEERTAEPVAVVNPFRMQWTLANELNLIFVVVYQGIQQLLYIDSLLENIKTEFLYFIESRRGKAGKDGGLKLMDDYSSFTGRYNKIQKKLDEKFSRVPPRGLEETKKNGEIQTSEKKTSTGGNGNEGVGGAIISDNKDEEGDGKGLTPPPLDELSILENRKKLKAKLSGTLKGTKAANEKTEAKKGVKVERDWIYNGKVTKKGMDKLDYSKNKSSQKVEIADKEKYEALSDPEVESEDDVMEEEMRLIQEPVSSGSRFGNFFNQITSAVQNLTGNKVLTEEELVPVLKEFKLALIAKNVAEEIAVSITNSVERSLIGQKSERFTSVTKTVKFALMESIRKILSPKKSIDVLRSALEAKSKGVVYSIVFLGVNGVGKSTNLAKVCYFLKTKGQLKVMIAACDTFRAGAVEQLQAHAKCLDVHLFERGYGRDAAEIAKDALRYAKDKEYDVVLIDTAGRMQDNQPLMRSLGKLVSVNRPDLILFVGEALVGNDGVDQVKKFNRCLIDNTAECGTRSIDGILLTKFDTVDDKVGAALSMVFATGQPIVFVGTGQKYPNLRKLSANNVMTALLS